MDPLNLFVKNLSSNINDTQLHQLFASYGEVVSVRVMINPATGESLGLFLVSSVSFF
jgi:RNA recognition motif-containing protein